MENNSSNNCTSCGSATPNPNCHYCRDNSFTKNVIEIDNPENLVLFHKIVVPSSLGDETTNPPYPGKYCNVLMVYEANGHAYLYSSDGIPTALGFDSGGILVVDEFPEIEQAAPNFLYIKKDDGQAQITTDNVDWTIIAGHYGAVYAVDAQPNAADAEPDSLYVNYTTGEAWLTHDNVNWVTINEPGGKVLLVDAFPHVADARTNTLYIESSNGEARITNDNTTWIVVASGGGGGGTNDFDVLVNRPKYAGQTMTSSTDIPDVTALFNSLSSSLSDEVLARQNADNLLQQGLTSANNAIAEKLSYNNLTTGIGLEKTVTGSGTNTVINLEVDDTVVMYDDTSTSPSSTAFVGTANIIDGAVTEQKLAPKSVTTAKIDDGAVTGVANDAVSLGDAKLALDTVGTPNLRNFSVSSDKLADTSVTERKLATKSVTTTKLGDGAVTGAANDATSVGDTKLAFDTIGTPNLRDESVTSAKIDWTVVPLEVTVASSTTITGISVLHNRSFRFGSLICINFSIAVTDPIPDGSYLYLSVTPAINDITYLDAKQARVALTGCDGISWFRNGDNTIITRFFETVTPLNGRYTELNYNSVWMRG